METKLKHVLKRVSWPAKQFAIHRETLPFDKLSDFFKKNYDAMYQEISRQGISSTQPPCAFYFRVDETRKEMDLAAAVPVDGVLKPSEAFDVFTLPASDLVTTTHYGSYENMGPAYQEMDEYLQANKLKKGLAIEEYLTDPLIEKDPAKWQTNIYFVIEANLRQ